MNKLSWPSFHRTCMASSPFRHLHVIKPARAVGPVGMAKGPDVQISCHLPGTHPVGAGAVTATGTTRLHPVLPWTVIVLTRLRIRRGAFSLERSCLNYVASAPIKARPDNSSPPSSFRA